MQDTLGWALFKRDPVQEARGVLEGCVRKAPHVALYHYHLGKVAMADGDLERARNEFSAALKLKLGSAEAADAQKALAALK